MILSAGAMFSTHTLQSQGASKPGRKTKSVAEGQETGKKPKKVNSEIRKQQNRIASRNYREKRKRKLQYLQQLLKDGNSTDDQVAQAAQELQGQRVVTPEYHGQGPAANGLNVHSNGNFSPYSSSSNIVDPALATTTNSYDSHLLPTTQGFTPFEPTWNTSMYEPNPPVNISSWNVPAWLPSIDFTPPVTSRHEEFQFTPPPSHHGFEQLPTPPQQSRTPDPDLFIVGSYGHCRRAEGSSMGMSNVSLPSSSTSSPYYHTRYPGAT